MHITVADPDAYEHECIEHLFAIHRFHIILFLWGCECVPGGVDWEAGGNGCEARGSLLLKQIKKKFLLPLVLLPRSLLFPTLLDIRLNAKSRAYVSKS